MSEIETLRRQTETLQNQFAEVSAMVSTLMRQAEEQRQHYDAEIAKKDAKIEEQYFRKLYHAMENGKGHHLQ